MSSILKKDISTGYFTAIDFETANKFDPLSVCQVGIAVVENFDIIKVISILIRPPKNYYDPINISIHGITPNMTEYADIFAEAYDQIKEYLIGQDVVAHNMKFDYGCLYESLRRDGIEFPDITPWCTYKIFGQSLAACCKAYDIDLSNHHQADADAVACAKLMILYQKDEAK